MAKGSKSGSLSPTKITRTSSAQKVEKAVVKRAKDYTSEGIADHDIFLLPGSDYQALIVVTLLAAVVRLFRIYQPSSVVFDEVQYVLFSAMTLARLTRYLSSASAGLLRSTSRANSSWMSIPLLRSCSSHWQDGWQDSTGISISRTLGKIMLSQVSHMWL